MRSPLRFLQLVLLSALAALPLLPRSAVAVGGSTDTAWMVRLFPHTGSPGHSNNRFRRLAAAEVAANGRRAGAVTLEYAYPDLAGKEVTAQARIYLPLELRQDAGRRLPLIHNAGYELGEPGAVALAARGYVVSTPHANPLNPLGRTVLVDRALLHGARALPFVDPLRVSIQGGSAGGWMTLMLAADTFPLQSALPDVPPIHWGYNAAYIGEQQVLAGPAPGSDKSRLPVLRQVGPIAEQTRVLYGMPLDSPTVLAVSPLDHLQTITAPTLVTFSTADILVPIDQVDSGLVQPIESAAFPAGFTSAMTSRFPAARGHRTLFDALGKSRYEMFTVSAIDHPALAAKPGAPPPAKTVVLPFTRRKTWSVVVLDEGPKAPEVGHFKLPWSLDHEPFRRWTEEQGVAADQLTGPKLQRLMKRLRAEPWRPLRARPGGQGPEIDAVQLDFAEAERADVLLGLRAFATSDERATRLHQVYSRLPRGLKLFGKSLGDGTPERVCEALARQPEYPDSRSR